AEQEPAIGRGTPMTIALALDARTELRRRIRASHMAEELAGMCADLCMEQVEPEEALRIACEALEKGMARLREGLTLLESMEAEEELEDFAGQFAGGSVN